MQRQLFEGFFKNGFMRNFPEFTRKKNMCPNLFFDKFKLCRSATSLKRVFRGSFLVKFAKFVERPFLQSSTGRLLLIVAVSIVVKLELANKTVTIKNGSLSERTGFRNSRLQTSN